MRGARQNRHEREAQRAGESDGRLEHEAKAGVCREWRQTKPLRYLTMRHASLRANRVVGLLALALLTVAIPVPAQEQTTTLGGRQVVLWQPHGAPNERHPIIVFSHGFGGCATQSRFLTEALAERGYWVFAPNHKDAGCGQRSGTSQPDKPFGQPD